MSRRPRWHPGCGADTIPAVRWACRRCGRFIAESAIDSWDEIDPGAYYGVTGRIQGACTRCGVVDEPRIMVFP